MDRLFLDVLTGLGVFLVVSLGYGVHRILYGTRFRSFQKGSVFHHDRLAQWSEYRMSALFQCLMLGVVLGLLCQRLSPGVTAFEGGVCTSGICYVIYATVQERIEFIDRLYDSRFTRAGRLRPLL
jgi:hypothetical protein